jgi:flagellar export protein FliJ
MKSFRFTLEAVRTLRQRQEQNALEQYAQSLLLRQQAVKKLEAVQHELNVCMQELRGQLAAGCTAAQAAQAHDYQRSLARRRDECTVALGTAERCVNAAMQAMLHARRQREVVDKFFDKQKLGHLRGLARSEQKMLDDLAGRRGNSVLAWNPTEIPS